VAVGLMATLINLEVRAVTITVKALHLALAAAPQISLGLVELADTDETMPPVELVKVVPAAAAAVAAAAAPTFPAHPGAVGFQGRAGREAFTTPPALP